ncbi:MAG TPA: dTMP kinase [Actinomycetota bacterium]
MASASDEIAALRGTKSATFKDLLTQPAFSRLLAAMAVSSLGDWVGFVAVASLVTNLASSPAAKSYAVAGVMTARMLPAILFGPIAGTLVDRVDRKRLMITSDLARGAMYASMPFLGHLWSIFTLSFFIECLSLLWTPARDASLPNLVPRRQLANANSVGLLTTYGTLPLGGLVFTLLAGVATALGARIPYFEGNPESLALWLDAGTFLFSAAMVSGIAIRSSPQLSVVKLDLSRFGKDILDGIRFLRENSVASAMTTGIVVSFSAVGAVLALGPIFARETLAAGAAGWGVLVTAFGIGMGIGLVSLNLLAKHFDRERIFSGSMILAAVTLFVLAAMPNLSLAAVVTVVLGFFCGSTWVTGYTLIQENVTDEYRGRTFGSLTVMARLGLFLSLAAFPLLAGIIGTHAIEVGGQSLDLSGTRAALWTAGLGVIIAGAVTRRKLRWRRLSKPKPLGLTPKIKQGPRTGIFIAFEGVEGAGKGTQVRLAKEFFEHEGFEVLVTREPGGTPVGEQVRKLLLDPDTGRIEPRTEALLFSASRAQHVATVIRPALAEGKVVICDRYVDSSLAYQGVARGLGEPDVLTLNVWATQGLFPDLVILLHLEPELGLLRSTEAPDRMELESGDFHAKVADAYLKIAEEHPERFVTIEADETPEVVQKHVEEALRKLLRDREEGADDALP